MLTCLWSASQDTRKRRTATPYTLHARIVLMRPFQPRNAIGVLCLYLLYACNVGLQPPAVATATVLRCEGLALRIHHMRDTIREARRKSGNLTSEPIRRCWVLAPALSTL